MSDMYSLFNTLAEAGASMGEIIKASQDDTGVIYLDRVREGRSSAERSAEEDMERNVQMMLMGWLARAQPQPADRDRDFQAFFTRTNGRPPTDKEVEEGRLADAHEISADIAEKLADFVAAFQLYWGIPETVSWTRSLTLHVKYPEENVPVQPSDDHP